jgi:hypothetical protein
MEAQFQKISETAKAYEELEGDEIKLYEAGITH